MLRLIPTTDTVTPAWGATWDTDSDTAVDTPPLDTLDLAIAVATTEDSATEVTGTPVVTTASARLRPSPRLMLIPTTDTVTPDLATLARGATEDTDSDTAVDTPPLDTLDLATAVDTTEDLATEVTDIPVLEATTASVRLSPRLMPMLRLIPTTDMVTPDLATLA